MAGRAAGSPEDAATVAWLVGQFAGLGLRPAVGSSLRQEFLAADPAPPTLLEGTRLQLRVPDSDGVQRTVDVPLAQACPFPFSVDAEVTGAVVFAGHGLVIPALELDDYAGIDCRDKVVMVLRGGPGWRRPEAPVREHMAHLSFQAKVAAATARGASAVIVVERSDRTDQTALSREQLRSAVGGGTLPVFWLDRGRAAQLFADGEAGLAAAQEALDEGRPPASLCAGAAVSLDVAMRRPPPRETANVIGLLPGTSPEVGTELIVIGAHHDHIGRGEYFSLAPKDELGRVHPGADDNASGTAALLELARRWQQRGASRRTLVFAAFGAEELGQRGSRWFLDHRPTTGDIVAMVDLNMIGRGRSGGLTIYGAGTGLGFDQLLGNLARGSAGLEVHLRDRTTYRSDQSAFLRSGVPALLLTTGLHEQYHRPGDVPELIEYDAAMAIVDLAERIILELADGPRRGFVPPREQR